jgi:hypothetical protein
VETIRNRVAGLGVHRDRVVVCLRLVDGGGRIKTDKRSFSMMTVGVGELAVWLVDHGITTAVMESTVVYWKPIYYGLEGRVAELWLVNATHVKRVPGRKTDVSDAAWPADVAAHGMVRPSYVHLRRSASCVSSPATARPRSMPEPARSSAWRRSSRRGSS